MSRSVVGSSTSCSTGCRSPDPERRSFMATGAIATPETPMLAVRDPARGTVIDELPIDDAAAVAAAVARARAAQPTWAALDVKERGRLVKRARRQLVRARKEILDRLERETGK